MGTKSQSHFYLVFYLNMILDTGLALTVEQFHALAVRLRESGVEFIIEPHLRFKGMPGEQYTMFFKDPSGTTLVQLKLFCHDQLHSI
jgi:extradiol dioxygenase family protein